MVQLSLVKPVVLTKAYWPSTKLTVVRVVGPTTTFSYQDPTGTYLIVQTPLGDVRVNL